MTRKPIQKGREGRLGRRDWIEAGLRRLATAGIQAVRVEVLAKDLGVSKGSFYWHFRDRRDLLDGLLQEWEGRQLEWLLEEQEGRREPAERWGRLVERESEPGERQWDLAIYAWARQDPRVASRLNTLEERRVAYIARVLRDIGFAAEAAQTWAELAALVSLGWADRATRDGEFGVGQRSLGNLLSRLLLAASGHAAESAKGRR